MWPPSRSALTNRIGARAALDSTASMRSPRPLEAQRGVFFGLPRGRAPSLLLQIVRKLTF